MRVGGEHARATAEGAREREERRPWEVEVGQEAIDDPKWKPRLDEEPRLAAKGHHPTLALGGGGLERTHDRRPDRHDRAPRRARFTDRARRLRADLELFAVHRVVVEIVGRNRLECPEADVERHVRHADAARSERLEERSREVETGGRRGDRARRAREDGLVALAIGGSVGARDVRRERDVAVPRDRVANGELAARSKRDLEETAVSSREDARRERVAERDLGAYREGLAALAERGPAFFRALGPLSADEEDLHAASARLRPEEARRNDAGVVEDEQRIRGELARELAHRPIDDAVAVDDEHPRPVAIRERVLRDELGGQLVVEEIEAHDAAAPSCTAVAIASTSRTRFGVNDRRRSWQEQTVDPSVASWCVASVLASAAPASGAPLDLGVDGSVGAAWSSAIEAARASLAGRADLDPGARVEILGAGEAIIVHVRLQDGRSTVRRVLRPDDLVVTLEALLTVPPPRLPPPAPPLAPSSPAPPPPPPPAGTFEVGIGPSAHVTFGPSYFGYGLAGYAQVIARRWLIGVSTRWDVDDLGTGQPLPNGFNMQVLQIAAYLGRRVPLGDGALDLLLGPGVTIDNQEALAASPEGIGGTRGEPIVALGARISTPVGAVFRLFASATIDAAPARVRAARRLDPELPTLPPWGLGISVGGGWEDR